MWLGVAPEWSHGHPVSCAQLTRVLSGVGRPGSVTNESLGLTWHTVVSGGFRCE